MTAIGSPYQTPSIKLFPLTLCTYRKLSYLYNVNESKLKNAMTQEERIKELEKQVQDQKWRIIELERIVRYLTKVL